MHCPFCGTPDTRVVDSRLSPEGARVRRRRECSQCTSRFTTYEAAELTLPRIVKQDQRHEAFDAAKLRTGMLKALEKRPVAMAAIEAAVQRIEHQARATGERELSSRQLGEWVMEELRQLDQVGYVRFASVYRSFQDIHAFEEEIKRLQQAAKGQPTDNSWNE